MDKINVNINLNIFRQETSTYLPIDKEFSE